MPSKHKLNELGMTMIKLINNKGQEMDRLVITGLVVITPELLSGYKLRWPGCVRVLVDYAI